MESYTLPEKTLSLWRLRVLIPSAVVFTPLLMLSFVVEWFFIGSGLVLAAALFLGCFYLPRYFAGFRISFREDAVIVHRGVFVKTTHIMPYSKMIYAETYTTPLAQSLGLSGLRLKAARSTLVIPEIEEDGARDIMRAVCGEGDA